MNDDVVQIEFLPDQHLQNYKYTLIHSYINLKEQNNVYWVDYSYGKLKVKRLSMSL